MALGAAAIAAIIGAILTAAGAGTDAGIKYGRRNKLDDVRQALMDRTKDPNDSLYGLTSNDIDAIVNEYKNEDFNLLDTGTWGGGAFDQSAFDQDLEDYLAWKDSVGPMPDMPDYDQIASEADKAIDKENAELLALYDEMANEGLNTNNQMYNDYVGQIMSNQAQSQNMLQGSVRSEMDRAQRNAIHRGATAAMKLVANVNTQLGLQNQAAQQSLETSNTLAQALLNQRQAAMQIRDQYTMNKANLIGGSAERKAGYRNQMVNEADDMYNRRMDKWENDMSGYAGSSVWGDLHRNKNLRGNQSTTSNSKYGI